MASSESWLAHRYGHANKEPKSTWLRCIDCVLALVFLLAFIFGGMQRATCGFVAHDSEEMLTVLLYGGVLFFTRLCIMYMGPPRVGLLAWVILVPQVSALTGLAPA